MRILKIAFASATLLISASVCSQPVDCRTGLEAIDRKEYATSIEALTRCLEFPLKESPRVFVLKARAHAYGEMKQYALAAQDQKESIQRERPKDVWPFIMLGAYYRELKSYDDSLAALKLAMAYDEDGPGSGPGMAVHYHMAQTLHLAGRYEEAIEACTKGIPKQPDYGYALYQRALSYEALGNKEQAKRDLFRAFELTPKDGYEIEVTQKLLDYGFSAKVRRE